MIDDGPISAREETDESQFFVLPDREKLEALAEFAAGAGHEINNPLATIIGRAQMLLKDEEDPQRRQMLMSIGAQAYRIRDMIGDTMLFGRPPLPEFSTVNLAEIVAKVVQKQADDLKKDRCIARVDILETISVWADPTQLSIVVSELIRNSRQASQPNGSEILIAADVQAQNVVIHIVDHGKGFTELERQHTFDPFFSGRQAGRGLGFGLPKCWRIVDQHNGHMEIQSSSEGPTTVRITLPIG